MAGKRGSARLAPTPPNNFCTGEVTLTRSPLTASSHCPSMFALTRHDSPLGRGASTGPPPPVTVAYGIHWFAAVNEQQHVLVGPNNWAPGDQRPLHTIVLPEPARTVHCLSASCLIIGETGRVYHIVAVTGWQMLETIPLPEPALSVTSWGLEPLVLGSSGRLYQSQFTIITVSPTPSLIFQALATPFRAQRARYLGTTLIILAIDGRLYRTSGWRGAERFTRIPLPEPVDELCTVPGDGMTMYARLPGASRYAVLARDPPDRITVERIQEGAPRTPELVCEVPAGIEQRIVEGVAARDVSRAHGVVVRTAAGILHYMSCSWSQEGAGGRVVGTAMERLCA